MLHKGYKPPMSFPSYQDIHDHFGSLDTPHEHLSVDHGNLMTPQLVESSFHWITTNDHPDNKHNSYPDYGSSHNYKNSRRKNRDTMRRTIPGFVDSSAMRSKPMLFDISIGYQAASSIIANYPAETVLEIGSGTGGSTRALIDGGAFVYTVFEDRKDYLQKLSKYHMTRVHVFDNEVELFKSVCHGVDLILVDVFPSTTTDMFESEEYITNHLKRFYNRVPRDSRCKMLAKVYGLFLEKT